MLSNANVERTVRRALDEDLRVASVHQERSIYSTSSPIDDVVVTLADGRVLSLIFKNLARDALLPDAGRSKPTFLHQPDREVGMYEYVLDHDRFGTARFYGVIDTNDGQSGILLEKVPGVELYQVGELVRWCAVAQWLRTFHGAFHRSPLRDLAASVPLLLHDEDYYRQWLRRALGRCRDDRLTYVASRHDAMIERLLAIPPTLIHGELYPSNVLIAGERVAAIDWEMAAVGPYVIDLGSLVSGGWQNEARDAIASAYVGGTITPDLRRDLAAARMHLALQWIGWSSDWVPPPEHAQDWIGEAYSAAHGLDD